MATIKMISEISQVSRGTVDRVLNGRGNVSMKTAAQVRRVAEQLGYKPNLAGKALAVRKKSYVIGVLLTSGGIPVFEDVIRGVKAAEEELLEYGVSVLLCTIKGYDVNVQSQAIDEMKDKVNALILNPMNCRAIDARIDALSDLGIPVITINTDVNGTKRLSYVGPDYFQNGVTAAGIMRLLVAGTSKKLAVFASSHSILGHNHSVEGFRQTIREKRPDLVIEDVLYTEDDDIIAYERAGAFFARHNDLDGIYIANTGTYGICRAVMCAYPEHKPVIVCTDAIATTKEMMKQGLIAATVCQQPFQQGYLSVRSAFDYLLSSKVPENQILRSDLRIIENLDEP